VPVLDPKEMQRLRKVADELLQKMQENIPYGRWHEVVETSNGGTTEITHHENFYALAEEVEGWNLSEEAWEFLESTSAYGYDRDTEQRRLSLASMRRGFYGAIFRLEHERVERAKPKKSDMEARLWAALEGAG
jgi:hypothetical protein